MSVGRAAFGTLKEVKYQGDYINILTRKCSGNRCRLQKGEREKTFTNSILDENIKANKTNIIAGLYYDTNLKGGCVLLNNSTNECMTNINPDSEYPFYWLNTIDPYGELFGNSIYCGVNNYRYFLRFGTKDTNK